MKYKLKLVRPDVAIGDMFSLSESGLISPPIISRQTKRNLKNTVQVKFNERWVGKTAEEIEAEEEVVDCTPCGNASYSRSGTYGYQVRSDGWAGENPDPPLTGGAGDGYTINLYIPIADEHYDTYGAYDTDEVSIRINAVNGYSTTFVGGYSGLSDPDDPRSLLISPAIKFWDFRNPTAPCADSWTIESYSVDPYSYLRTTTMNQEFRRGGTIGLTLKVSSSNVAFKCPFTILEGDISHPDWREGMHATATDNGTWPPEYHSQRINNMGYKIFLGTPL